MKPIEVSGDGRPSRWSLRWASRVALGYLLVAFAWIYLSDRLLARWLPAWLDVSWAQTAKGFLFVVVTAALLFLLVARVEAVQRQREALLEALVRSSPLAIVMVDSAGRVMLWNPSAERMFGWRAEEILGEPLPILPPGREAEFASLLQRTLDGESITGLEVVRLRRDGGRLDLSFANAAVRDAAGQVIGAMAAFEDIGDRKRAEDLLRLRAAAMEVAPSAIVVTDPEGRIEWVNPAFTRLTGYRPEEALDHTADFLRPAPSPTFHAHLWSTLRSGKVFRGHLRNRRKDGTTYSAFQVITAVRDEAGEIRHLVGVGQDVTEKLELEARVHRLAFYDPVTGLLNRTGFAERCRSLTARAEQSGEEGGIVVGELRPLRAMRRTFGWEMADAVSRAVAERVTRGWGETAVVGWLDDGRFALAWSGGPWGGDTRRAVEEVADGFGESIEVEGREIHPDLSFGAARQPEDGVDYAQVLERAETALHRALEDRVASRHYAPELYLSLRERVSLENDLRSAIRRGELTHWYQPIYDLSDDRVAMVEALARWPHPQEGLLRPSSFLPIAEGSDLIVDFDRWSLGEAIRRYDDRLRRVSGAVSVNVSAATFERGGFEDLLAEVLAESALEPRHLVVEITETVAMVDPRRSEAVLRRVRELGVGIALDDFGVAYSSLSYLRHFPVQYLKLDRSFVAGIGQDPRDERLLRTVLTLARDYGLEAVAEGVESSEQLAWLRAEGCRFAQGHLLARPAPAEDVRPSAE